jgi:hypothetical protein
MRRALLVLALASLAAPSPAAAWCQMTSSDARPSATEPCVLASMHPGSYPLAWRHRCSSISISSALPPDTATMPVISTDALRMVLERSIATWTTADCGGTTSGLAVTVLDETNACTHAVHYRGGRNVHSVIFVTRGWATERMHDPRALAVTYVWHDPATGEILDADMELNEELKDFHICASTNCADLAPFDSSVADLENALTHEMGHYFGLAHTSGSGNEDATMWSEANPGETIKRDLTADDIEGLCTIYETPLPPACDPTPVGGLGLECTAPPGCGCHTPGRRGTSAMVGVSLVALALALVARRRR